MEKGHNESWNLVGLNGGTSYTDEEQRSSFLRKSLADPTKQLWEGRPNVWSAVRSRGPVGPFFTEIGV